MFVHSCSSLSLLYPLCPVYLFFCRKVLSSFSLPLLLSRGFSWRAGTHTRVKEAVIKSSRSIFWASLIKVSKVILVVWSSFSFIFTLLWVKRASLNGLTVDQPESVIFIPNGCCMWSTIMMLSGFRSLWMIFKFFRWNEAVATKNTKYSLCGTLIVNISKLNNMYLLYDF